MTAAQELLTDAARRAPETARLVLDGLSHTAAHEPPGGIQNPVAWLIWHAARQQDVQVSQLAGTEQVWDQGDWAERTGVNRSSGDMGFGDSAEQATSFLAENPQELGGYLEATVQRTVAYIQTLDDESLAEVIDSSWDPPVTRGVRLVSTIDDAAQHLGQAAYARSLVEPDWKAPY